MLSTTFKTVIIVFAVLIGFLIFQQVRTNQVIEEKNYSYLDHQREKYDEYKKVQPSALTEENDSDLINIANTKSILKEKMDKLDAKTKALVQEKEGLQNQINALTSENKKLKVSNERLAAENVKLKAELNALKQNVAKPTSQSEEINAQELLGMFMGVPVETFQVEGLVKAF